MPITFTREATPQIASATDATSYASSSWTPTSGALYILFVGNVKVPASAAPTVSGNGITWTAIDTQLAGANTRLTAFYADGTGATAGATTVSYGGNTQRDCHAVFIRVDGTDIAASGAAGCIVQAPKNSASASGSLSITLAAAGNANNRALAAFVETYVAGVTPRSGWTEEADLNADSHILEVQTRADAFETTASASTASGTGDWGGIAIEIKAPVTASFVPRIAFS